VWRWLLKVSEDRKSGYTRARFGKAWKDVDRNGCDQSNDVLRRDMEDRHTKPGTRGCVLASGVLLDDDHNYASYPVAFTRGDGEIAIDYVVSLHNAWDAGAYSWSVAEREKFANDFMNLEAIDTDTDQTKR
jgi:hypothetical protein